MKILYLSPYLPAQPLTGGDIHNRRVLKHLAAGNDVTVLTAASENGAPPAGATYRVICVRGARRGRVLSLIENLLGWVWSYCSDYWRRYEQAVGREWRGGAYDLLWADGYYCAPYLRRARGVPSVLMTRDSQARYHYTRNLARPALLSRLAQRRLAWFERRFYPLASRVVFLSRQDAQFHAAIAQHVRAALIALGVDTQHFHPGPEGAKPTVLFSGAMNYAPNADAALWFAREIMPQIAQEEPGAEFVVAGHSPGAQIMALERAGRARVTGYVEDLRAAVQEATVFVSPLRFGSGVKTKVLEAMAMGKAIVATPLSCDGIEAQPERDVLLAATPGEFRDQCVRLLRDKARRVGLGANARRAVETHHTWPLHFKRIDALLDEVINEKRGSRVFAKPL